MKAPSEADPLMTQAARLDRIDQWGIANEGSNHLAEKLGSYLDKSFGVSTKPRTRNNLPKVPESRLDGSKSEQLARLTKITSDPGVRLGFSLGKSYPDLIAARSSELATAFDAVARPANEDETLQILEWCASNDVNVVPVGGGTTVVGGIEPVRSRGNDKPVIAVDTSLMNQMIDVDMQSGLATMGAGIRGPRIERMLEMHGLTLGHTPQSFEYSTLGGWIATRSAGQLSLAFGKIERMTAGLTLVTPEGKLEARALPAHGAGSDPLEMIMGSEGTFGIITSATMRVRTRPDKVRFSSWIFPSFSMAIDAVRQMIQSGIRPGMVRVSDKQETAFSISSSVPDLLKTSLPRKALSLLGVEQGTMVIVITPGSSSQALAVDNQVYHFLRSRKGIHVGPVLARHWYRSRFLQPYARDILIDRGYLVDTLETSISWKGVTGMHASVRGALEDALGPRSLVGCHLSHLYPDGASLYFTFVRPIDNDEDCMEIWRSAKRAANAAILSAGGAASHQHGIGTMHAALHDSLTSRLQSDAIRAIRHTFDPSGVCAPGRWPSSNTEKSHEINFRAINAS